MRHSRISFIFIKDSRFKYILLLIVSWVFTGDLFSVTIAFKVVLLLKFSKDGFVLGLVMDSIVLYKET